MKTDYNKIIEFQEIVYYFNNTFLEKNMGIKVSEQSGISPIIEFWELLQNRNIMIDDNFTFDENLEKIKNNCSENVFKLYKQYFVQLDVYVHILMNNLPIYGEKLVKFKFNEHNKTGNNNWFEIIMFVYYL